MIGRIYDSGYAYCKKCGSDMWLSSEKNQWGPICKNKLCDGTSMDAVYVKSKMDFRCMKLKNILKNYKTE